MVARGGWGVWDREDAAGRRAARMGARMGARVRVGMGLVAPDLTPGLDSVPGLDSAPRRHARAVRSARAKKHPLSPRPFARPNRSGIETKSAPFHP